MYLKTGIVLVLMLHFLLTKPTEASKSQKNDSKFSTKTKTMHFKISSDTPTHKLQVLLLTTVYLFIREQKTTSKE